MESSYSPTKFDVKRIAIVGAGPIGLSAATYLVAQKVFDEIVIYERQYEVGGI
jgi:cation diffusion facilitator CzcD-associated flavoprotein CzcO